MFVDVTFTFHCSVAGCGVTDTRHFEQVPADFGSSLPLPAVPRGWWDLGTLLFCPKHVLALQVDGQEVTVHPAE